MFTAEVLLTAACTWLLWRNGRRILASVRLSAGPGSPLALMLPALTLVFAGFGIRIARTPHGAYDGWAVWNWEARLLYRGGSHWRAFLPFAYHGDYPLLVPSITARFWRYMGMEVPEAGAWLGVVLALCSIAVLVLTLAELRSARLGTLFGLTLIGTPSYLNYATSQYADVPVGFFFLASLALIAIYFEHESEPESRRIMMLAGFLAGCSAWTKNEGIVFIIALSIALLMPVIHKSAETLRRVLAFGAGAAVPLIVVIVFKATNNVQNYIIAYHEGKLQLMLHLDRHEMILSYLGKYIFSSGGWAISPYIPLLALILAWGFQRRIFKSDGWRTLLITLLFVCAGYYFVYLTTPADLKWHIETSMERLFLQLWPSFLLLAGLMCRPAYIPGNSRGWLVRPREPLTHDGNPLWPVL
ncbi:MAG TPA: hypothetical protein VGK48_13800 [Terriglobia bacterium]